MGGSFATCSDFGTDAAIAHGIHEAMSLVLRCSVCRAEVRRGWRILFIVKRGNPEVPFRFERSSCAECLPGQLGGVATREGSKLLQIDASQWQSYPEDPDEPNEAI